MFAAVFTTSQEIWKVGRNFFSSISIFQLVSVTNHNRKHDGIYAASFESSAADPWGFADHLRHNVALLEFGVQKIILW